MHRRSITKGNDEVGHRKQIIGATASLGTIGVLYNKSRPSLASLVSWYRTICLRPFKAKRRDEKKNLPTIHRTILTPGPRLVYTFTSPPNG